MGRKEESELQTHLQQINDDIEFYLELFRIPESKKDDSDLEEFLLDTDKEVKPLQFGANKPANTAEELAARVDVMKNKITAKSLARKGKQITDSGKLERKKLKKEQTLKRKLLKIGMMTAKKEEQRSKMLDHKPLVVKQEKKLDPTFNPEGKIVFSKFQLDENDKPKKGIETDKKKLLKKVIQNKKHLTELKESGDIEKYAEVKKKQAWEKAMAKTEGQKVRDDPALLAKKVELRKKQIKKSKEAWKERNEKVEQQKIQRQKQRTTNIKERASQKKNKKLQKLAKKGRIIPGF
ncbi:surfeit locus protein 6 homolog [Anopheles ziemanni]|uniref:surfeit locus protein 6 homolog n=1 Tax=Anopheles coustani TaxID=139045 RepID=UPI00265B5314|nr:surfeit locus protein 6 homolog [Anopheles coustani]XP_058173094.1 surfeit locus protein 6 homolog [Anopheles ziemanni]